MSNRLADAVSPYLRSHADNPVDWFPWGEAAFAEARRRDVPVLISIGYATCHWCHVMARESFSDPALASYLNENLVAIKVDREEHPDVDAAYLAAASAFTPELGWPLTVFATPSGTVFYAGTYYPPTPVGRVPAFRAVIDAIVEAWRDRRDEVVATGEAVRDAVRAATPAPSAGGIALPDLAPLVARIAALEDATHGGLGAGGGPKFPNAPVVGFLLARGAAGDTTGDATADALGRRLLAAALRLQDPVEGGAFRYAVRPDWTEPHYERMLSDNAQLLRLAAAAGEDAAAQGFVRFLTETLRLPSGLLASAQDSESLVDGARSEGGYYALDAAGRAMQPPPALDAKVLTGLNGLAIGALAEAGFRAGRADWISSARALADRLLAAHLDEPGALIRASRDGIRSEAVATLEDVGGLAGGLLRLALATGDVAYAVRARTLVHATRSADGGIAAPGGADPVLAARGLDAAGDPSDGATPSGRALLADAALLLDALGDPAARAIAEAAIGPVLPRVAESPTAFGAALEIAARLAEPIRQLVVVVAEPTAGGETALPALAEPARAWRGGVAVVVTAAQARAFADADFELFAGRDARLPAAYLCEHFVCALPVDTPQELAALLGSRG